MSIVFARNWCLSTHTIRTTIPIKEGKARKERMKNGKQKGRKIVRRTNETRRQEEHRNHSDLDGIKLGHTAVKQCHSRRDERVSPPVDKTNTHNVHN